MLKKTVVFLGHAKDNGVMDPKASGFLVRVNDLLNIVTAKHVVYNFAKDTIADDKMYIFFNGKNGQIQGRKISEIKRQFECDWIFHKNREVDVAIIPFGMHENDDVKFVPNKLFHDAEQIHETLDIFFLSYQPGIKFGRKISPIFREGIISSMNDDRTFYIDAAAFPGNSGSPVFLKPGLVFGNQIKSVSGGKLIGIIGEYVAYTDTAYSRQTGRPRIVFEENTGLSRVWSVSYIQEIIASPEFQSQSEKIP